MTSNKYALIKWLDVEDAGHFTVGVPVNCILDFNEEDFLKNEADMVYIVKWKSSNGLKYCEAIVVEITEDVSILHRRVKAIGGALSTRIVETSIINEWSKYDDKNQSGAKTATTDSNNTTNISNCDNLNNDLEIMIQQRVSEKTSSMQESDNYDILLKAVMKNRKMITEIYKNVIEIKQKIDGVISLNSKREVSYIQALNPDKPEMVEIGKAGSKVFITARQWIDAQSKGTFRNMGLFLLTAVFPKDVLMESNLKGGTSKILPKNCISKVNKPLDPIKVQAIMDTVKDKFPNDFSESIIRIAINNKLSNLRIRSANIKKRDAQIAAQRVPQDSETD